MKVTIGLLVFIILFIGCSKTQNKTSNKFLKIKLDGNLSERSIEASGLTWYKDNLIILPQFPHKWSNNFDGAIFFVPKARIENYINGNNRNPIVGEKIDFVAEGLDEIGKRKGSGYEAITFIGDSVYVSIESVRGKISTDFIVQGIIDFNEKKIILDSDSKIEIPSQSGVHNMGEETLFAFGNNIFTIHEANGINVNNNPKVFKLNENLREVEKLPFQNIDYRITDATNVDTNGKFFVINYFYPGEFEKLKPDLNESEREFAIEQILELQIVGNKIIKTDKLPIKLSNGKSKNGYNWEGIVRFNDGFILVTDKFPGTVLAYFE